MIELYFSLKIRGSAHKKVMFDR